VNKYISTIVLGTSLTLVATTAEAGILSVGSAVGAPGDTVSVSIDLSSLGGVDFTSIDAALQISGGAGDSPLINGYVAAPAPSVWDPFTGVNYTPAVHDPLAAPALSQVMGISGDAGATSTLDGPVMDVSILIPATATIGSIFDLDLDEGFSVISNAGVPLDRMTPFGDGTLEIIPEPATGLMALALGLVGLGFRRRRR
jgi:hypothetical protein